MVGTKTSGRPGGNPELQAHKYKPLREGGAMPARVAIRFYEEEVEALKKIPDWNIKVRELILGLIKQQESS